MNAVAAPGGSPIVVDRELPRVTVPAQRCENCRWFARLQNECRARPPTAFLLTQRNEHAVLGVFPATKLENWCKEWEKDTTTE